MKILLHSFTLWPNVGGVESVSHVLASGFVKAGHSVTVLTETDSSNERPTPYRVVRNPSPGMVNELVSLHDLVHSNGASVRYFLAAKKRNKPFSWTHQTYQIQCIDGFGWVKGHPAPLTPLASIAHHYKIFGMRECAIGTAKLLLRRQIAQMVNANVAITHNQARLQPLPRQRVIYNPIELGSFAVGSLNEAVNNIQRSDSTFTYLGRLISEKGVDDLLRALAQFGKGGEGGQPASLKIIGDGPERQALQSLANELGIADSVKWLGQKTDDDLAREIRTAGICVLPSAWEEPMGIAVVELMAAGKPLIVSKSGGLSECGGDACRTFANRDSSALARVMEQVHSDKSLQTTMIRNGLVRIKDFDPDALVANYLDMFTDLLGKH